jgi:pimeloyl-ACP methyl ester carboxylesterase
MYFEVNGTGAPLLMIHGGLVDSRSWFRQLSLEASFRLILPDLPGFGQSAPLTGSSNLRSLARDVADTINAAGQETAHVLGFSFGGIVAQALVAERPTCVRSLVLVSTLKGGDAPTLGGGRRRGDLTAHLERALSPRYRRLNETETKRYMEMAAYNHARGSDVVRQSLSGAPAEDELRALTCPTLIIHAREDRSVPLRYAQELQRAIPSARLVTVAACGHSIHLERPQWFNSLVKDFITGMESDGRSRTRAAKRRDSTHEEERLT